MKSTDLHALRAEALLKLADGDTDAALASLKALASSDVEAADAYIVTGSLLRDKGEHAKAERIHKSILEKKDLSKLMHETAVRELIKDAIAAEDYKSALLLTETVDAGFFFTKKKNIPLLPFRAYALEKSGHLKEAAELYKKCAGLNPVYLKKAARCWFAASKDIAEDRSYAIKLLTNAENCDPSFFEAKAEKANLQFLEGKRSKGLSLCEEIIKNELPKCPEHMSILEEFHYAHSDIGSLFNSVMKKINSGSANVSFYIYAARYHARKNEADKAKSIISICAAGHSFPAALAAAHAEILKDELFISYFKTHPAYRCTDCTAEHISYSDICAECASAGTLTYL